MSVSIWENVFSKMREYSSTAYGEIYWHVSAWGRIIDSRRTRDSKRVESFSIKSVRGWRRVDLAEKLKIVKVIKGRYGEIRFLRQRIRFSIDLVTSVNNPS